VARAIDLVGEALTQLVGERRLTKLWFRMGSGLCDL
jgi:hypothetical protein